MLLGKIREGISKWLVILDTWIERLTMSIFSSQIYKFDEILVKKNPRGFFFGMKIDTSLLSAYENSMG